MKRDVRELAEGTIIQTSVRWNGEDWSLLFRIGSQNGARYRKASFASSSACSATQAICAWRESSLNLFGWDSCEDSSRALPTSESGKILVDMSRDCDENFILLVGEFEVFQESPIRKEGVPLVHFIARP